MIDSLTAIRRVVYRDHCCSLQDVADAIDHNFVGYEKLRSRLSACPKYGANEEEADEIGSRLTQRLCESDEGN